MTMTYFIGYREGEIVKPVCIILPQRSGYIKYFQNGGKNMSFMIKNVVCQDKYNEIWDKIKETLNIKFHSMLFYDEKYIKAKVREFNGVIKTSFLGDEIPKEGLHYACMYICMCVCMYVFRHHKKMFKIQIKRMATIKYYIII